MLSSTRNVFLLYMGVGVSARAIHFDNWNTTISSSISLTKNICHLSTTASRVDVLRVPTLSPQSPTTSTDDYPPVTLQSATDIARPVGTVTSLAISISGDVAEPQSYSVIGILPSAPAPELHSEGSTGLLSHHASVLSPHLPTGNGSSVSVTTPATTQSTSGLGYLLVAINSVASRAEHATALSRGLTTAMSDSQSTEEPQNALSVLLSALPSDVASSIEAGFSVVTHNLLATSGAETTRPTSRPTPSHSVEQLTTSTSVPDHRPTSLRLSERTSSGYTAKPISDAPTSRPTGHPTLDRTSSPPSRPTSHPDPSPSDKPSTTQPTTFTTRSSTTSSLLPSTTSTPETGNSKAASSNPTPPVSPEKQQANGTIAGVATGAAAGIVLITLAIFFFLRRRQRQRALQDATEKPSQPYPEVAWLYDPVRSPPRSRSPAPPAEAGRELGTTQMQAQRNSMLAPEVVMPEGEPLLAPGRAATRDNSPSAGGRGRSASPRPAIR